MSALAITLIILVGLCVGSFLNVCIYRIPKNESVVYTHSHCTSCNEKIRWYDNIPVLSYIILKGKCRKCGEKISIRYPFIELLNAVLYLLLLLKFGNNEYFYILAVLVSIFIIIGAIDFEHQIIPDSLIVMVLVGAIAYRTFYFFDFKNMGVTDMGIIYEGLIGAVGAFVAFYLLYIFSHGGIGGGDVKLIFPVGLIFGFSNITWVVLVSSVAASIYAIVLLIAKKANRKTPIPFGTFLAIGVYIMLIFGQL